ncbi:MAG: hypothetical protein GY711_31420 [bacterium]|nr:hypothetical protein [bacterium]
MPLWTESSLRSSIGTTCVEVSMNCHTLRDVLIEAVAEQALAASDMRGTVPSSDSASAGLKLEADARAHLSSCGTCSALMLRLTDQSHALVSLTHVGAPQELEGRVVATLHPGHRQDRAVRSLGHLAQLAAPALLRDAIQVAVEHGVDDEPVRAPAELDERVAAEIEHECDSATKTGGDAVRALRALDRLIAPRELDELVRLEIQRTPARRGGLRAMAPAVALVAAGFLLWFGVLRQADTHSTDDPLAGLSFEVERLPSFDRGALSPETAAFVSGLTGIAPDWK